MKPSFAPASAFNVYVATDAAVPGKPGASAALIDQFNKMPRGAFVFVQDDPTLLYYKGSGASYGSGNRIRLVSTGAGGFVPPDDNLTDLGDPTHRFRTLYLGDGIVNSNNLNISLNGGGTTALTLSNNTAGQVADFYLDGAVRFSGPSPEINAANDMLLNLTGGGTVRTFAVRNSSSGGTANIATDGSIIPDVSNAQDLGAPDTGSGRFAWRSLYLRTSIETQSSFDIACAGGGTTQVNVVNPTFGQVCDLYVDGSQQLDGVLTFGQGGGGLIRAGFINTPLYLHANGNGAAAFRDTSNSASLLGVRDGFVVGAGDDQTNANGGAGGDCTVTRSFGKAAIAVGQTACVVTVAGLSPAGVVTVTAIDRDVTAVDLDASCGSGSFTVTAAAAATAKTRFNFVVITAG